MMGTYNAAGLFGLTIRILSTLALSAVLIALPTSGHAQPPGGDPGNCTACVPGIYCVPNGSGGQTCYTEATFCAGGTDWGWNDCDDDPPYGNCTVSDGTCDSEQLSLVFVPEGIIDASPEIGFVSAMPCAAARSVGAVARVVSIDSRKAAFLDNGNDQDLLLIWLSSS